MARIPYPESSSRVIAAVWSGSGRAAWGRIEMAKAAHRSAAQTEQVSYLWDEGLREVDAAEQPRGQG